MPRAFISDLSGNCGRESISELIARENLRWGKGWNALAPLRSRATFPTRLETRPPSRILRETRGGNEGSQPDIDDATGIRFPANEQSACPFRHPMIKGIRDGGIGAGGEYGKTWKFAIDDW